MARAGGSFTAKAIQALGQLVDAVGNIALGAGTRVSTTSFATVTQAKETVATIALPANSMSTNGKSIRVVVWGITAANANVKVVTIDFGATTVSTLSNATNGGNMVVEAIITRTGAATQEAIGWGVTGTVASSTRTTPAETTTGAINILATATTVTAAGDFTFKGMVVEFLN